MGQKTHHSLDRAPVHEWPEVKLYKVKGAPVQKWLEVKRQVLLCEGGSGVSVKRQKGWIDSSVNYQKQFLTA